jgi:hypothetical protein
MKMRRAGNALMGDTLMAGWPARAERVAADWVWFTTVRMARSRAFGNEAGVHANAADIQLTLLSQ